MKRLQLAICKVQSALLAGLGMGGVGPTACEAADFLLLQNPHLFVEVELDAVVELPLSDFLQRVYNEAKRMDPGAFELAGPVIVDNFLDSHLVSFPEKRTWSLKTAFEVLKDLVPGLRYESVGDDAVVVYHYAPTELTGCLLKLSASEAAACRDFDGDAKKWLTRRGVRLGPEGKAVYAADSRTLILQDVPAEEIEKARAAIVLAEPVAAKEEQ